MERSEVRAGSPWPSLPNLVLPGRPIPIMSWPSKLVPHAFRGSLPKISRLPLHLSTYTWGGKRDWRYYQYRVNHTYLAGSLILISSRIREKTEAQALVTYKE